jgi:hypothetical protein
MGCDLVKKQKIFISIEFLPNGRTREKKIELMVMEMIL